VAFHPDAEPGMFAIMKRLRDGIQPDDILVKTGAFLQIHHV
jgi:hypothetical protein